MVMCFVPYCRHYSERQQCRYFHFPLNERLKATWIALIGKIPTKHSTVCSCHFENADRKNLPTIFNRKRQCRLKCKPPSKPRSKPLIRKKVSEEKSGKLGSSTESASETEEMEALIEAATKAINQPERRVHCSTSSASKSEDIEGSIYREHSYSLWKNTRIEKEKNMQFEFVNCMSETKYLDESDDIFSSSQNVPVKGEVVQNNTSNVIYGNVENEERINMRDDYLSHIKKEAEDDTDFSDVKIKQEEMFIKDEIIEEESESSPSTTFLVLQTVPILEIYNPEHVS